MEIRLPSSLVTALSPGVSFVAADHYPLQLELHPRFGDVDIYKHLNNVAQSRYYEEGVARFHRQALAGVARSGVAIVGEVRIRYLAEGRYPQPLTLHTAICHIGRSSYALEQTLWQDGHAVSICRTTNVYREQGVTASLPQEWRERFSPYLRPTRAFEGE